MFRKYMHVANKVRTTPPPQSGEEETDRFCMAVTVKPRVKH